MALGSPCRLSDCSRGLLVGGPGRRRKRFCATITVIYIYILWIGASASQYGLGLGEVSAADHATSPFAGACSRPWPRRTCLCHSEPPGPADKRLTRTLQSAVCKCGGSPAVLFVHLRLTMSRDGREWRERSSWRQRPYFFDQNGVWGLSSTYKVSYAMHPTQERRAVIMPGSAII